MNKLGFLTCASMLMIVIALPASGQRPDSDFAEGRLFPAQVILEHREALALAPEQSRQIRDILSEFQGKVSALRWDMVAFVDELRALLDEESVDEGAVTANAEELMALESNIKLEQLRMLVKIRNVLTAEQLSYLKSLPRSERRQNARDSQN